MPPARHRRTVFTALAAYVALIAYGSLFPFEHWQAGADSWAFLGPDRPARALSLPDLVVNGLIYIPLGVLLRLATVRQRLLTSAALALLAGGALSLCVEAAQSHLPQRVPALSDLILNTTGALLGALLASLLASGSPVSERFSAWRQRTLRADAETDLVLIAIAVWALAQLAPFVPSLDLGMVRSGLKPLAAVLDDPSRFDGVKALTYAFEIAALGLMLRHVRQRQASIRRPLGLFVLGVLIAKAFVVSRQISGEALVGAVAGLAIALGSPSALRPWRGALAAGALAIALVLAQLAPEQGALRSMNMVPFLAHLNNPMRGLSVLLDSTWPYLVLATALHLASSGSRSAHGVIVLWSGLIAFALEWLQQYVPGRTPDLTAVLVAVAASVMALSHLRPRPAAAEERPRPRRSHLAAGLSIILLVSSAVAIAALGRAPAPTTPDSARSTPKLPAPEELRLPPLPEFRYAHPRLPHPSAGEILRLRTENPDFVSQLLSRAKGGRGDENAAILAAVIAPESQDIRVLTERLLALKPTWRGHAQTKPIAQAYDWLHDRIPPDLMPRLKDKVIEACNHQIRVIRTEALSPYNVYLYNSPFQALVACALAIHGDDPRAQPVMAFTYDLWINRVLPVWRQIGGRNGGWHEGNEYVGIGIGQAIYQVPAMWRAATGQDFFHREALFPGFLNFLVMRQLPDGTSVRIGDGRHGRRAVDDAQALALEFGHSAAYTVSGRPDRKPVPTSWPWGPLTDNRLYSPEALRAQPLTHFSDGTGWLLARSGWDDDATHLSFKAGDNYWSHTHLDQGSFTLFKGAPLAIDSGCYCGYGTDHHLNYHYQTIAHTTLTVTDPLDTLPMPARPGKQPRTIANDGGQRRVGSGWDLHAAPTDLDDWLSKYEDFHTGRMVKVVEQDGLLIALADITAAYTNRQSGSHSFHHRTRRVERAWRILIYDRPADTLIVQDTVEASRPEFAKRWLLHSAEAPRVDGNRFVIERAPVVPVAGLPRLEGEVLFPRDARITPIGGKGFEFFADGQNYDESGTLAANIAKGPADLDPGAWRLEISPAAPAAEDRFLVVLRPGLSSLPPARMQAIETADGIGAELALPGRTLKLSYPAGRLAVDVTVEEADGSRHALTVAGEGTRAPAPGWIDKLRAWMSR